MSKHQILPGSLEVEDGYVQAGVHTGPSEWQLENLRYVRAPIPANPEPGATVLDLLGQVYDNSEGCLVKGDFREKTA